MREYLFSLLPSNNLVVSAATRCLATAGANLVGMCSVCNHTLPSDSSEYVSPLVSGFFRILSNFFCPGPHSCLVRCRFPIRAHASAWSCNERVWSREGVVKTCKRGCGRYIS